MNFLRNLTYLFFEIPSVFFWIMTIFKFKEVEIRVEVTNLRTWYKILGNEISD